MLCPSPASLLEGVKEVRSEVLSLFIPTSRELVGSRTKGRQQRWRDGTLGIQPRRDKGCMRSQTPPPLLVYPDLSGKGGEGVRGRDGTLGIQPQRDKGCMRSQTPPPLLKGGEGVRGRDGALGISRKGIKDVCAAKLPRLPRRGGKGGAVSRPHQREAVAMAGWYTRHSAAKG